MFTGIIEAIGIVENVVSEEENIHFFIHSEISNQLKIDQSVAHNGVCLTVVKKEEGLHMVTAVKETLDKSTLGQLEKGSKVNLERCMQMNGRLDGHMVYGHVDGTGVVEKINEKDGSWEFRISFPSENGLFLIEKGSICLNGISLTGFNVTASTFDVAVIPYTFENTTMNMLQVGQRVNLEIDVIGKYIVKILNSRL